MNFTGLIYFWNLFERKVKNHFWMLIFLMIIVSVAEIVSIGAILPFLGALTDSERVYESDFIQPLVQIFELSSADQIVLLLTIGFIALVLIAGILRIALLYALSRFERLVGTELAVKVYSHFLRQNYISHINQNSSDLITIISNKSNIVIREFIKPVLSLISSIFILALSIVALLILSIQMTLTVLIFLLIFYWGVAKYTQPKLSKNSQCIASESTKIVKILQESSGNIKSILIDESQDIYCKLFRESDIAFRNSMVKNNFISASPRFIVEGLIMTVAIILIYHLSQQKDGILDMIPMIGLIVFGVQKLLPVVQQVYNSISSIKGVYHSFEDILSFLDRSSSNQEHKSEVSDFPFKNEFKLKDVSFRYSDTSPWVLKDLNLTIPRGRVIGIMGGSGDGKSTLLNIIIGLISPVSGTIAIDGKTLEKGDVHNWKKRISHVPQDIHLSDDTIEKNIAFGVLEEQINHERIVQVAKKAGIGGVIEGLPEKYQTIVGERGAFLSGGQRQRIGIARALYKKSEVFIFDEATSALDNEVEEEVLEEFFKLKGDFTILIASHHTSILKKCDFIIKLNKGENPYLAINQ
jgi:ATP-binding cassette, subfamily B, bacterial PglK